VLRARLISVRYGVVRIFRLKTQYQIGFFFPSSARFAPALAEIRVSLMVETYVNLAFIHCVGLASQLQFSRR
jgi:hypothetical protein